MVFSHLVDPVGQEFDTYRNSTRVYVTSRICQLRSTGEALNGAGGEEGGEEAGKNGL